MVRIPRYFPLASLRTPKSDRLLVRGRILELILVPRVAVVVSTWSLGRTLRVLRLDERGA